MKNTRKLAAVLLAMATAAASLAGCGSAAKESSQTSAASQTAESTGTKSLNIGFGYDASSLDPGMASDDATLIPVRMCNEPLFRMINGEAQPGIAETYEASED